MVKEENAKKVDKKKEVEVILPKKDEWENRFKMFKLYINKLKGMNQEEFRNDLLKFLKEEEKIDCNTDKNNKEYVDNDKKENKIYDDELEQYYLKSRKDCVEYGLKSSDENLIVCTKYE